MKKLLVALVFAVALCLPASAQTPYLQIFDLGNDPWPSLNFDKNDIEYDPCVVIESWTIWAVPVPPGGWTSVTFRASRWIEFMGFAYGPAVMAYAANPGQDCPEAAGAFMFPISSTGNCDEYGNCTLPVLGQYMMFYTEDDDWGAYEHMLTMLLWDK